MFERKQLRKTVLYAFILMNNTPGSLSAVDSHRSKYPNVAYLQPTADGPHQYHDQESHLAVDGELGTHFSNCSHTKDDSLNWWLVDLQTTFVIYGVAILNRDVVPERLANFTIDVFLEDPRDVLESFPEGYGQICTHQDTAVNSSSWGLFDCERPMFGRHLRVVKYGFDALTICEMEVFALNLTSTKFFGKVSNDLSNPLDSELLGYFHSPAQCALTLLSWPKFENFVYDPQTGSCIGTYSNMSTW